LNWILPFIKIKKNNLNSHVPPSKDENQIKTNPSSREKTGKKPGGQYGNRGKKLEFSYYTSQVDQVV
jgi:hypothetical protein